MPIDEGRTFLPVRIAVLTVSDTRTLANDRSGDTLVERTLRVGGEAVHSSHCPRNGRVRYDLPRGRVPAYL